MLAIHTGSVPTLLNGVATMKSLPFISSLALALTAGAALATDQARPGGFTGPDAVPLAPIADAIGQADGSAAKVQGYIVRSLGDEKYEFRDNSGTVTVEIDNEDWRGIEATPETRLELLVEVDREWRRTELDVESVRLVQ